MSLKAIAILLLFITIASGAHASAQPESPSAREPAGALPPAEAQTERRSQQSAPPVGAAEKPLASVAIHATANRGGQIRQNATTGELRVSGVDASRLLRTAWDVVETELEIKAELPDAVYDVHVIPPAGSPGAAGRMLQAALDALFRTTSRKERRSVPGYRLSIAAGASPLRDSAQGRTRITLNQGGAEFDNVPIADIVRRVGVLLGGPMANDTGLNRPLFAASRVARE